MRGETRNPLVPDQEGVLPLGMEGETLVSRFLPGGNIQAETVTGTNMASGAQLIGQQHIHVHGVPGQPRSL